MPLTANWCPALWSYRYNPSRAWPVTNIPCEDWVVTKYKLGSYSFPEPYEISHSYNHLSSTTRSNMHSHPHFRAHWYAGRNRDNSGDVQTGQAECGGLQLFTNSMISLIGDADASASATNLRFTTAALLFFKYSLHVGNWVKIGTDLNSGSGWRYHMITNKGGNVPDLPANYVAGYDLNHQWTYAQAQAWCQNTPSHIRQPAFPCGSARRRPSHARQPAFPFLAGSTCHPQ